MFRFADVPLSLSGMTRIAGRRVYLRAPTMEDWAEWAELRARSRDVSHAVGTDLAGQFAGPRSLPPPPAPAGARMARGRGLRPVRLPQRSPPPGRRHQPQQRAPRCRPGGFGRLLDGPALCRPGADDGRAARAPALRVRRAAPAPARGRLPAAQRARPRPCWPRSASTRKGWRASICGSTANGPTICCSRCCVPTTIQYCEPPLGKKRYAQSDTGHHHQGLRRLRPQGARQAHARPAGGPRRSPASLRAREQGHAGRMDGRHRRADARDEVHRRQAQRVHPVLRPAGRLLAGRHGECREKRHAVVGAGTVPHRGRARDRERRRPVEGPGRRAAGGERQDRRPRGQAGQGNGAGAVAELRQRPLRAAGRRAKPDQLSRPAEGRRRRHLRLTRRCGRCPTPCPTTGRPATCCVCSVARPGGRRTCT